MKLLLVAGARPNFMKVAPLIKAIQRHNASRSPRDPVIESALVHTGQHYDPQMSDVFFRELGIPKPEFYLGVGSGSHAVQTANVMIKFEPVCLEWKPDWVVVLGDINSTLACTLVASKLGIKVAHVEAGLRSNDRTMPEEINRIVTDALADLLLTPSEDGNVNLKREGVPDSKVKLAGNIMIDSLLENWPIAQQSPILKTHQLTPRRFVYVTLHRPANVDDKGKLGEIMQAVMRLSQELPVVFPMHPRTRKMLSDFHIPCTGSPGLKIMEPIGYHESLCLSANARVVLTDSGGLQEETTYFRTPCLTLRPNTERPITVSVGSNRLTTTERLPKDLRQVLDGPEQLGAVPAFWDGGTAERIVKMLLNPASP